MYEKSIPLLLHTETPLHVGSGNDLGYIDLPIQREKHTTFPKIEGSGLKGAIREALQTHAGSNLSTIDLELMLGPEESKGEMYASAVGFTDARLLLFPVKSAQGIFAWITCPLVLDQLAKDFATAGKTVDLPPGLTNIQENQAFLISSNSVAINSKVILEEYSFEAKTKSQAIQVDNTDLGTWLANQFYPSANGNQTFMSQKLEKDIVVIHNDAFRDFTQLSTEVITRIKISRDTGVVASGGLWTEEYLPSDTVLYSMAMISKLRANTKQKAVSTTLNGGPQTEVQAIVDLLDPCLNKTIQIGGNSTVGKGFTKLKLV